MSTAIQSDESATTPTGRRVAVAALVGLLLLIGLGARSIAVDGSQSVLVSWLPWLQRTQLDVYYAHPQGLGLVPVSRSMPDDAPAADLVDSLLAGPDEKSNLVPLLPAGTYLASASLEDGLMTVALTGDQAPFQDPLTAQSVWLSLTSWPEVERVALTIGGQSVDLEATARHVMYFWDHETNALVAQEATGEAPGEVLAEYLDGPSSPELVGLPDDVRLLDSELNVENGLLKLNFSFVPSLRTFALDDSAGMRRVLEGLIATMTITFPEVDGVYLDFEGQTVLGLGACADLLRSLQLPPDTLNDERLLARALS